MGVGVVEGRGLKLFYKREASHFILMQLQITNTVEPRYLELAYFELPLISKWKSGPCFNMKLWQQVTK